MGYHKQHFKCLIRIHMKSGYGVFQLFYSSFYSIIAFYTNYMISVNITNPKCVELAIHHHRAISSPSLAIKRASQHNVII